MNTHSPDNKAEECRRSTSFEQRLKRSEDAREALSNAVDHLQKQVDELTMDRDRLDWLRTADVWFEDPCDGNWTPDSWRKEIDRLRNL